MFCKKCDKENPPIKKHCQYCSNLLEGYTINNVTGCYGYSGSDGMFYDSKETWTNKATAPKDTYN